MVMPEIKKSKLKLFINAIGKVSRLAGGKKQQWEVEKIMAMTKKPI